MKISTFLAFAFICGLTSCSPRFTDGNTFFRHRVEHVERRSSPAHQNPEDLAQQWLQRYYHHRNNDFDQQPERPVNYDLNSPEKLQWLVENIVDMQQDPNNVGSIPYSLDRLKVDDGDSLYDGDENEELDYSNIYNIGASILNNQMPIEPSFQQTLNEYLMQQNENEEEKEKESAPEKKPQEVLNASDKKSATSQTVEDSTSSSTSTTTSSALESLSKTTVSSISPTASSNSLSVMPPVHFGKGQKEYPMLRPASENGRKFDNYWAENFQNSMMRPGRTARQQELNDFEDYKSDPLTEQLNKLKTRSRRDVRFGTSDF